LHSKKSSWLFFGNSPIYNIQLIPKKAKLKKEIKKDMETITKSEWRATPKDYKCIIDKQRYILKGTTKGTALVPVKLIADKEAKK
jgi:hypothetical protein